MKPHEPLPPLLLTMIMKAIVIPRATSRLRSLEASPGRGAVLADGVCVTVGARRIRYGGLAPFASRCPLAPPFGQYWTSLTPSPHSRIDYPCRQLRPFVVTRTSWYRWSTGERWEEALKAVNVAQNAFRVPGAGHGLTPNPEKVDYTGEMIRWFDS